MSSPNWQKIRKDFPVTRNILYLDHAAAGPLPRPVYEEGVAFLKQSHEVGDLYFDRWLEHREVVRAKVAELIGAHADEIGFTHNTSEAMNIIADHMPEAREVVLGTLEFPSSTVPWIHRNVPVRWVKPQDGKLSVDSYARAMGKRKGVIVSSLVQFCNGFRQDVKALGAAKKNHRFVVNSTQGLGVFPVNVRSDKIDALASGSYKWFLAGYGGGIVYLSRKLLAKGLPAYAGWRSIVSKKFLGNKDFTLRQDAGRCEYGCPSFQNIFMIGRAIDYQKAIGYENIAKKILELTAELIEGLQRLGLPVDSPLEPKHRSGIVVFAHADAQRLAASLYKRRVFVSARGAGIRVAPHFYNDSGDIQKFLNILKTVL